MNKGKKSGRLASVIRFSKPYIGWFLLAELCILASYGVSVVLPLNLTRLTDNVLYGHHYDQLRSVIITYIFLFAIAVAFNALYAAVWQYLQNHYIVDVKNAMYSKIVHAKSSFLSGMNSGDMMSRIDGDSEQFIFVIQRNVFHFVNSFVLCATLLIMVARINPTVSIMLFIAAVIPIFLTRFCGRFTEKHTSRIRNVTGKLTGRVYEILKGFRELRLACADWWITKQVLVPLKKLIHDGNAVRTVQLTVNKGIDLINLLVTIGVYAYSAYLVIKGSLTVGLFLAIVQYIALLHRKLNWMLSIYLDWFGRKISIDRVNEVLDLENERQDGEVLDEIRSIEFRHVSFGYEENQPVFRDISLKIEQGTRTGIVGISGVGKTTLTSLLMGYYEPESGEILVNGRPMAEISLASLREKIGVVSQEILLFDESIRYNLCFGREATDAELEHVLRAVGLWEVVSNLPEGLNTRIGPTSSNLSGGQKQRLMIARVMLKKTPFILLDEATSALDVETEKQILDELAAMDESRTFLIISHRFAAVRDCDRLIVLDNGRIQGVGTHAQLQKSSPLYRTLFGGNCCEM